MFTDVHGRHTGSPRETDRPDPGAHGAQAVLVSKGATPQLLSMIGQASSCFGTMLLTQLSNWMIFLQQMFNVRSPDEWLV